MNINIDHLSKEQLIVLNRQIIERLKLMDSVNAHQEMMQFNVGDQVSFHAPEGKQIGMLTKHNRKTVTVITESGQRWNVSPHLLSKVKKVKPTTHEQEKHAQKQFIANKL